MNRSAIALALITLGLIAGAAGFLDRAQKHQRLGMPGVKLVDTPIRDEYGNALSTQSVWLPESVLGGQSATPPITRTELDILPADTTYGRRIYHWPDKPAVQLSVVLMGADRTSIHKPEYCLAGQGYEFAKEAMEVMPVPMTKPFPYELPVMTIQASHETGAGETKTTIRGIYLFWFVNDREISAQHAGRMVSQTMHVLRTGELQRWAYISCFARCLPGQEALTLDWMKQVIADAVPQFQLPPAKPTAAGPLTPGK
jgi:hypothetical protein